MFPVATRVRRYGLKIVTLAGAERLPALSAAMTVNVFSPLSVAYKMVRSPVVEWSRTPFW